MAGEWRDTTLGEFVTLQRGHDLTDAERRLGTVAVMGAAGQNGFHDKALAKGPGIVIGRSGASFGQVHYCDSDFWPHNTGLYVTDFRGNDPRFAFYFLKAIDFSRYNSGSAQPSLNRNFIYPIDVQVPPPDEQRAIAHILGTLDDKIEMNRRMNETLKAMARALFKSWFVDFLPVRAKAAARTQTGDPVRLPAEGSAQAGDPGLPKHIAEIFPNRFENSELGEIPEGWEVGPILKQAKLLSGGTPKTDCNEYWDGNVLWASAKDVSQCGQTFLVKTERRITQKGLDESATQLIPSFCTVVVARGATTGRMVMFGREMAMNQTCYALASITDTPFEFNCHLQREIDNLVHAAHGSVFDTNTTSTFDNSKVVVPPVSLLKTFDQKVAPMFRRILGNTEESQTVASVRDTLLSKLLSGELRVKDSDDRLAEDRDGIQG